MPGIRIVLIDMPRLLRDIVSGVIAREPGLEVVAALDRAEPLLSVAERHAADLVIAGLELPEFAGVEPLLRARPGTRVLAVGADGVRSTLYELAPRAVELGELSPARLLEAIRG